MVDRDIDVSIEVGDVEELFEVVRCYLTFLLEPLHSGRSRGLLGRRCLDRVVLGVRRIDGVMLAHRWILLCLSPLPGCSVSGGAGTLSPPAPLGLGSRSEEHTSELQSRGHLVCRLLL